MRLTIQWYSWTTNSIRDVLNASTRAGEKIRTAFVYDILCLKRLILDCRYYSLKRKLKAIISFGQWGRGELYFIVLSQLTLALM